jgi:hypothetical protein
VVEGRALEIRGLAGSLLMAGGTPIRKARHSGTGRFCRAWRGAGHGGTRSPGRQDRRLADMDIAFLSLLLVIPLGIASNLLTGRVSRWWVRRRETGKSLEERKARLLRQSFQVSRKDPEVFTQMLIISTGVLLVGIGFLCIGLSLMAEAIWQKLYEGEPQSPVGLLVALAPGLFAILLGIATRPFWKAADIFLALADDPTGADPPKD